MIRKLLCGFLMASFVMVSGQTSSTDPMYKGRLITGDDDFDQILQTQLTLHKSLLNSKVDKQVTCYFNLDEKGNPVKVKLDAGVNNLLKAELLRMFRFFQFRHTLNLPNEERPYFVQFDISADKYSRYIKQKHKFNIKKPLPADSSYQIYTKVDMPPVYYKNGDEGLNEYILEEVEYPKVARERSIQGTVMLDFTVETNGYITGITVKQGVNGGCTEEAIRIMKTTRWIPASLNGKFVRYKVNYPITFTIPVNRNAGGAVNGL